MQVHLDDITWKGPEPPELLSYHKKENEKKKMKERKENFPQNKI